MRFGLKQLSDPDYYSKEVALNELLRSAFNSVLYAQQIAYVAAGSDGAGQPEYIGYANPGSSTASAVWSIKKMTYNSDNRVTGITWADGNNDFDNVWDNHASLSYS